MMKFDLAEQAIDDTQVLLASVIATLKEGAPAVAKYPELIAAFLIASAIRQATLEDDRRAGESK